MKTPRRASLGELRPSQLLYTYGVGSVVDLPHISVMVMGLDDWDFAHSQPVKEERLLAQVRARLGPQVQGLVTPPMREDLAEGFSRPFDDNEVIGVPVAPFPRWMRCPACRILAPLGTGLFHIRTFPGRPDLAKYVHTNCNKLRQPAVLPARFLLACEAGHLDDFPWSWFVHKGAHGCNGILELRELGVSGEAAGVEVRCRACEANRRMADAFGDKADLPICRSRRPHLRDFQEDPCKVRPKTILLGASNSWFAITLPVLYVPTPASRQLDRLVEHQWNEDLSDVDDASIVAFLRKRGKLAAFAAFTDEEVFEAIERRHRGAPSAEGKSNLLEPEWQVFSNPDPKLNGPDFELREVGVPERLTPWVCRVVLAERLREVTALTGFTRIGSPRDYVDNKIPKNKQAALARTPPTYVPATEVRGEGIFLQFHEKRLADWVADNDVLDGRFDSAHTAWRRRRNIEPEGAGFPGLRYVVLHTFAHALMRELALECGYTAASLRERLYSRDDGPDGPPMAGVLIYTAAPDSEGTLGGLVRMGRPDELGRHVRRALEQIGLCSSDPLCADHLPERDGATLHGASCHACIFAPETSCERGNKYLDRAAIVGTIRGNAAPFFEGL